MIKLEAPIYERILVQTLIFVTQDIVDFFVWVMFRFYSRLFTETLITCVRDFVDVSDSMNHPLFYLTRTMVLDYSQITMTFESFMDKSRKT